MTTLAIVLGAGGGGLILLAMVCLLCIFGAVIAIFICKKLKRKKDGINQVRAKEFTSVSDNSF